MAIRRQSSACACLWHWPCALCLSHFLKQDGSLKVPVGRQEERQSFTEQYIDAGFSDAFREQHPGVVGYTYFSHRFGMRAKGKGWRLDYYLVTGLLLWHVQD